MSERDAYFVMLDRLALGYSPGEEANEPLTVALVDDLDETEAKQLLAALEFELPDFVSALVYVEKATAVRNAEPGRYLSQCRRARITKQELAKRAEGQEFDVLYRTAQAAIEFAHELRLLRKATENDETPNRFEVTDKESGRSVIFDATGMQHWHGTRDEGWSDDEMVSEYTVRMDLFRDAAGFWTLVSERFHNLADFACGAEAERLSDAEAAEWLVRQGHDPPLDVADLAAHLHFRPGPPVENAPARNGQADRPVWNRDTGELHFRGRMVRKVKHSAKNVRLLLASFAESNWEYHADSPFPPGEVGKGKLRETVASANEGLTGIRFFSDGSGEGACWEVVDDGGDSVNGQASHPDDTVPF